MAADPRGGAYTNLPAPGNAGRAETLFGASTGNPVQGSRENREVCPILGLQVHARAGVGPANGPEILGFLFKLHNVTDILPKSP